MPYDFNARVGKDDIFKPTTGDESLHEISNGVELEWETLPRLKIGQSKAQCSHIAISINILGCLPMVTPKIRLTIF
jgi:hypothetical protein